MLIAVAADISEQDCSENILIFDHLSSAGWLQRLLCRVHQWDLEVLCGSSLAFGNRQGKSVENDWNNSGVSIANDRDNLDEISIHGFDWGLTVRLHVGDQPRCFSWQVGGLFEVGIELALAIGTHPTAFEFDIDALLGITRILDPFLVDNEWLDAGEELLLGGVGGVDLDLVVDDSVAVSVPLEGVVEGAGESLWQDEHEGERVLAGRDGPTGEAVQDEPVVEEDVSVLVPCVPDLSVGPSVLAASGVVGPAVSHY